MFQIAPPTVRDIDENAGGVLYQVAVGNKKFDFIGTDVPLQFWTKCIIQTLTTSSILGYSIGFHHINDFVGDAMIKSSVYERSHPREPRPLTVDRTTDEIKIMCTECILSALKDITSDPFRFSRDRSPFSVVLSECVVATGVRSNDKIHNEEKRLADLFYSVKDQLFYMMIEAAHYAIINHYNHKTLSDNLNTIFERNYVGIRVKNREFIFIEEETVYEEFIEPCLTILFHEGFDQANNHLYEAFDRCHEGDFENAVRESSLALESVVDQILEEFHIPLPEKKNDFMARFRLLKENGVAIFQDDSTGQFLQSIYSPIRARNNMPGVAHIGPDLQIDEEEAQYVLGCTVSSILYIVRSYLNTR